MKTLLMLLAVMSFSTVAVAETYKLPAGTTFRAYGIGYDCGEFFKGQVEAPREYASKEINFTQFSADKDLNTFLIEATYPAKNGEGQCIYGAFFNRDRESKKLNLDYSLLTKTHESSECSEEFDWLNNKLTSVNYYASKRGIRYIAVDAVLGENDVCSSNQVRMVFDRRAGPQE